MAHSSNGNGATDTTFNGGADFIETSTGEVTPDLFCLGASTLLNDVLMQIEKERAGSYRSGDYLSKDGAEP